MSAVERPSGHGDVETHTDHERPEDWGWHADLGKFARLGGYISIVVLLVLLTATHYNHSGSLWLIIFIAFLVLGLIWDHRQRKTNWR